MPVMAMRGFTGATRERRGTTPARLRRSRALMTVLEQAGRPAGRNVYWLALRMPSAIAAAAPAPAAINHAAGLVPQLMLTSVFVRSVVEST